MSDTRSAFQGMVGDSPAMQALIAEAARVAGLDWPVLITGETGTGKTALASAVHAASGRPGRFVVVNCAALAQSLVESELFGYRRGAFTGAAADTPGLFEAADGGSLLLDEIGDLALEAQAKVLRAIDARVVRRVGDDRERTVDVRIIGATHQPLEQRIAAGAFREDLYYRINTVQLHMPALRDRASDLATLANHFLRAAAGRQDVSFSGPALERLMAHDWPGNLRELQAATARAWFEAEGAPTVTAAHLPPLGVRATAAPASASGTPAPAGKEEPTALSRLLERAIDSRDRTDWGIFLLRLLERTGSVMLKRDQVTPYLRELRGESTSDNVIELEWKRSLRQQLLDTGLVSRSGHRFRVDVVACREAAGQEPLGAPVAMPVPASPAAPGRPAPTIAITNLPGRPVELVGRDEALEQLAKLVNGGAPFVTVIGPGGIGKTALARAVGQKLLAEGVGGVWFVDLREARDASGVAEAIERALGRTPGDGEPGDRITRVLRGVGRALLLLDNFEQLVNIAPGTIGAWRMDVPDVQWLVTSRSLLGLNGEVRFEVTALQVPSPDDASPGALMAIDSVRLFVQRARQVRPGFSVDPDNATAIGAICRGLSGVPLAIELAAARVRSLTAAQLAERLDRKFELLHTREVGRPEHQRALGATLDWSYDLLEPWEQSLFRRLCVFRGGFTLEAAEAVLAPLADGNDVIDGLESLVDRSFIRFDLHDRSGPRYDIYVVIRDYGRERLAADPQELADVEQRHAEWMAEWAQALSLRAFPGTRDSALALRQMASDRDNLLAARAWALAADRLELAVPVDLTLGQLGLETGGGWALTDQMAGLRERLPEDWLLERTRLLLLEMRIRWFSMARFETPPREALYEAIDLAREKSANGDREWRWLLATALGVRAWTEAERPDGDVDAALATLDECEQAWASIGQDWGVVNCHFMRASAVLKSYRRDEAMAWLLEGERVARRAGPSRSLASVLHLRTVASFSYEEHRNAMLLSEEAIRMLLELERPVTAVWWSHQLAHDALESGDLDIAGRVLPITRQAPRLVGSPFLECWMACLDAAQARVTGEADAMDRYAAALDLAGRHDQPIMTALARIDRARMMMAAGDVAAAAAEVEPVDEAHVFPDELVLMAAIRARAACETDAPDRGQRLAYVRERADQYGYARGHWHPGIRDALEWLESVEPA